MKRHDNLPDTAGESRGRESNSQRGDGMEKGDAPLLPLGEGLGVVRVVGQEINDVRRVRGSLSRVGVVHDGGVDAGGVEDEGEVADGLGRCGLPCLDIAVGLLLSVYYC